MLVEITFVDGTSEYLSINELGKRTFRKLIKKYKRPFSAIDLNSEYYKSYCFPMNKKDWIVLFFTDRWLGEDYEVFPSRKDTCKPKMYWVKTKHGKLPSEYPSVKKTLLRFKKELKRELPENLDASVLSTWVDS